MNYKARHKKRINAHRRKISRRGRKGGKGSAWRKGNKEKVVKRMIHKELVK